MVLAATRFPGGWSFADLLAHLGGIPAERVRLHPVPGRATEQDVLDLQSREDRLYELVDGVLVEKPMGYSESYWAGRLIRFLGTYVEDHDLGIVTAPDGTVRLGAGLVRIPDVAYFAWERLPGEALPEEPIPDLAPDLAVEVLSEGNTAREMERKLREYFFAGTRLVWLVDPRRRIIDVYTAPDQCVRLEEGQILDGGDVVPGFHLALKDLFGRVRRGSAAAKKKPTLRKKGKTG